MGDGFAPPTPDEVFLDAGYNGHIAYVCQCCFALVGVLYRLSDGSGAIATRGSFVSEQALHATEIYSGAFNFSAPGNNTFLFEIVYPDNRIVVDYGDRDELVYLGYVKNDTGRFVPLRTLSWLR